MKLNKLLNATTLPKKPYCETPPEVFRDPLFFIGFGLGSGAMPFAPGTFGTLFAIPFYLLLQGLTLPLYLTFVIFFIIFSSVVCDKLSQKIHLHDHPGMCIDEFAGFFVTMINAPAGITAIVIGFILFRIFDILKPWPIGLLDEKVHGGFGMVIDDVVAGVFACILLQLITLLIP